MISRRLVRRMMDQIQENITQDNATSPVPTQLPPAEPAPVGIQEHVESGPIPSGIIDQSVYPIQKAWIWENLIYFSLIALLLFSLFGFIFWVVSLISLILHRKYFTYRLESQYLVLKQGIISKQERHILYGVIQTTFVKQGLLDRFFGLACLVIENASQGGGKLAAQQAKQRQGNGVLGFSGNKVTIPGLKKDHAEQLKTAVLQKMKENPIVDTQSGI